MDVANSRTFTVNAIDVGNCLNWSWLICDTIQLNQ